MEALVVTALCASLMFFMWKCDQAIGDFMGMIVVLAVVGLAILAVVAMAGVVLIPILLAIVVPIFFVWFCFSFFKQCVKSPEDQAQKTTVRCLISGKKTKVDPAAYGTQPRWNKR